MRGPWTPVEKCITGNVVHDRTVVLLWHANKSGKQAGYNIIRGIRVALLFEIDLSRENRSEVLQRNRKHQVIMKCV